MTSTKLNPEASKMASWAKMLGTKLDYSVLVPHPAHAWYRKELTPTSCVQPHTHTHKHILLLKKKKVQSQHSFWRKRLETGKEFRGQCELHS